MNRLLVFPIFILGSALQLLAAAELQTSVVDEARAALQANDPAKAAALLEPLAGLESNNAAACHALSQVRLAQKNAVEAVVLAERATVLDPTKAAYFSQLGIAIGQRMGELTFMQQATMSVKLRKAFAKAVELDPKDLFGLIGLARFYANAPEIAGGSFEKAREFALRVQLLDPFLGAVELGNIAVRDEKFGDALNHFEDAAKLKPSNASVQIQCGQMLARLGRKDEARVRYETVLKLNPALEAAKKALAEIDVPAP